MSDSDWRFPATDLEHIHPVIVDGIEVGAGVALVCIVKS